MPLITLAKPFEYEEVIKKSRFIARARRVDSAGQAQEAVASLKDPTARHNCWAYRIGESYRFSDDGEPGGTAGRPILGAIDSQGVDHVVVVVTRFFGGIKLGAGGLARAYGGTAASCLRLAERVEIIPTKKGQLRVPFESLGSVYHLLDSFEVQHDEEAYDATGVRWNVEIVVDRCESFEQQVRDATRGRAVLQWESSGV